MKGLPSLFQSREKRNAENYAIKYFEALADLGDKIDMLSHRLNILEDTVFGVIDATQNQQKLNNNEVKYINQNRNQLIIELDNEKES